MNILFVKSVKVISLKRQQSPNVCILVSFLKKSFCFSTPFDFFDHFFHLFSILFSLFLCFYKIVCKSCIVKHLEEKNTCPNCHIIIHQSHPLHYISYDRTLQDIVYKLVPNLQKSIHFIIIILSTDVLNFSYVNTSKSLDEIEREKEFYLSRVLPYPRLNGENNTPQDVNSNPSADLNSNSFNYHRDDEQIGVELISFSESHLKQVKTRYIKCSSQLTITQMKKIISLMLFKTCDKHHNVKY